MFALAAIVALDARPVKAPVKVVADILPADILPVVVKVPSIFAPTLVTTNTLATPPTEVVTLPAAFVIVTLLVPLTILLPADTDIL